MEDVEPCSTTSRGSSGRQLLSERPPGRAELAPALTDDGRAVYRYTVLDLETGNVASDVTHTGYVPYVNQLVHPGVYVAGIEGASDGLYAVDPSTGDMLRLTSVTPDADQEGYENHPNSQFATDPRLPVEVSSHRC